MEYILNCNDIKTIRALTSNHVLVVTEDLLMRGVDYKCQTGIDLFIDKTSANERAYIQCLGRVARGTDAGDRYKKPYLVAYKPRDWSNNSANNKTTI